MVRRIRLDKLVVVDLELTCWNCLPPDGEVSEIISIGAAELILDEDMPRVGRTLDLLVRPMHSTVSEFCTHLTGITPAIARRGRPVMEACATLRRTMGGSSKAWGGWGDDRTALEEAATRDGFPPPMEGPYIDLGALWGMLSGARRGVGLSAALQAAGMEFEGTPHRALDDAVNTARLVGSLAHVLRQAFPSVSPSFREPGYPDATCEEGFPSPQPA